MNLRLVPIRVSPHDDDMMNSIARNLKKSKAEIYREAISSFLSKYDGRFNIDDVLKEIQNLKSNQELLFKMISNKKGE